MSQDPDFAEKIPSAEEIEEGRRGSLLIGVIVGAVVIAIGIVAYALFGKYLAF